MASASMSADLARAQATPAAATRDSELREGDAR
jgi:hypothetical protein